MSAPPQLSIIIPSYRPSEALGRTLQSLRDQAGDVSREVIVVDCSPDDAAEQIIGDATDVTLVRVQERFTPGIGRNLGAERASAPCLVFIDADVCLSRRSLEVIATQHAAGHKMFGGALELAAGPDSDWRSAVEHDFFNHENQSERPAGPRESLSSALMIVDREFFWEHGGFSDIPRMQDTELCRRVRSDGGEIHFFPGIQGFQTQNADLPATLRKARIVGRNSYALRFKDKPPATTRAALAATLPLLALAKTTRIVGRHLRHSGSQRATRVVLSSPLLYACGLAWMYGGYQGLIRNDGISGER